MFFTVSQVSGRPSEATVPHLADVPKNHLGSVVSVEFFTVPPIRFQLQMA
jgi:hypothetical protein